MTMSPSGATTSSSSGRSGVDDQRVVAAGRDRRCRARRRSSCRRARPRRSCRGPARRGRPGRRTPRPAPGGRGRRPSTGVPRSAKRRIASIEMPASVGRARAGRDDHAVGLALEQLVDRRGVVAHDVELGAELAQVLDEVVGERVVVVDRRGRAFTPSPPARTPARSRPTPRPPSPRSRAPRSPARSRPRCRRPPARARGRP